MGRKRRSKATPTKQEGDLGGLPDEVLELLFALLDLCGSFFSSDEGRCSSRLQLLQSLKGLSSEVKQAALWDGRATQNDESSSSGLRLLEERIAGVRCDADAFLETIDDERSEIFGLSHEFDCIVHSHKGDLQSWHIFVRSLVAEYRIQCQVEEQMARGYLNHTLDSLYSLGYERHDLQDRFQQLIRSLSREKITQNPQFQEGVALIRLLMLQGDDRAVVDDGLLIRSVSKLDRTDGNVLLESCYALADEEVVRAKTAWEAFEAFLRSSITSGSTQPKVTTVLVVGSDGSGKTHLCNEVERWASSSTPYMVIRPQLPLDILQGWVGETEDVLISLGGAILSHKGSVLVIMDNVEHLLDDQSPRDPGNHILHRCQSTLLALLDSLRTSLSPSSNVLLIFTTSAQETGSTLARFDRIFHLEPPDEQARKALITTLFLFDEKISHASQTEKLLLDLVDSTVGRSYAELVQYCRQSIESTARSEGLGLPSDFYFSALVAMKARLQSITPESLRGGVIDDYVDMRVLTARDLLSSAENSVLVMNGGYDLPLRGNSAAHAWKALQSSIIIPLCCSKELYALLDESSGGAQKSVIGAILLTGEAGSGKSEIAMHCARYAAQLLPSVKLIDVSCTSLIHKEVGGSEKAVHHLFDAARRASPCILLMDGMENVAAVRGNDSTTEGTMDRVLSTLLVELDGVEDGPRGGIAVIGITQDARWIDPALKRPGRLDRAICLARDWT